MCRRSIFCILNLGGTLFILVVFLHQSPINIWAWFVLCYFTALQIAYVKYTFPQSHAHTIMTFNFITFAKSKKKCGWDSEMYVLMFVFSYFCFCLPWLTLLLCFFTRLQFHRELFLIVALSCTSDDWTDRFQMINVIAPESSCNMSISVHTRRVTLMTDTHCEFALVWGFFSLAWKSINASYISNKHFHVLIQFL